MGFLEWLKRSGRRTAGGEADETYAPSDEEFGEEEVDPFDPFPDPVSVEIRDVFDLHTIPPRDVKRVVEAYLIEARAAGFRAVRIIHGKGRGVQRRTVHAILERTPFVADWSDAPPGAGGLGATVVRLSPPGPEASDSPL